MIDVEANINTEKLVTNLNERSVDNLQLIFNQVESKKLFARLVLDNFPEDVISPRLIEKFQRMYAIADEVLTVVEDVVYERPQQKVVETRFDRGTFGLFRKGGTNG